MFKQLQPVDFLSKLCKDTFAGYAISQIKKARGLNKKILNLLPKHCKSLLDFCYVLTGQGSISVLEWLETRTLRFGKRSSCPRCLCAVLRHNRYPWFQGAFNYDDLIQQADQKVAQIEASAVTSHLPNRPDVDHINQIFIELRTELYKEQSK